MSQVVRPHLLDGYDPLHIRDVPSWSMAVGGLLRPRKTIQATHYGAYKLSGNTHELIDAYAAENGLETIPGALEFYTNDPTTVAPEDVETLIVYDLAK